MNAAPDSESFDVELNAQDSSLFAEGLTVDGGRAKLVKMPTEMLFVCLILFVHSPYNINSLSNAHLLRQVEKVPVLT